MGTSWQLISDLDALARAAGERGLIAVVDAPADLEVSDAMARRLLRGTQDAVEAAIADPDARIVLITVGRDRDEVVVDVLHDGLGDGACRRFVVTPEVSPRPGAPLVRAPRRR